MVTRSPRHKVTRRKIIMKIDETKKGYKKLLVWQKADDLAFQVYLTTKKFPSDELFGVTSQLRRSALSVPTNIVEGSGRQNKGELRQFLNVALGSLAEVEYLLEFSLKLKYLQNEDYTRLELMRSDVGGLLWNFYKAL